MNKSCKKCKPMKLFLVVDNDDNETHIVARSYIEALDKYSAAEAASSKIDILDVDSPAKVELVAEDDGFVTFCWAAERRKNRKKSTEKPSEKPKTEEKKDDE